jgi:hypothetical protein
MEDGESRKYRVIIRDLSRDEIQGMSSYMEADATTVEAAVGAAGPEALDSLADSMKKWLGTDPRTKRLKSVDQTVKSSES